MGSRIGRPRRLSPSFLRAEREKLHRYRTEVRRLHIAASGSPRAPLAVDFPYQVGWSYPHVSPTLTSGVFCQVFEAVGVGDMVTALHLPSCSLQRGQVLAVNTWTEHCIDYLVQFEQVELGHGVVPDDMLASHGPPPVLYARRRGADDGMGSLSHGQEGGGRAAAAGGREICMSWGGDERAAVSAQPQRTEEVRSVARHSGSSEELLEGMWEDSYRDATQFILTRGEGEARMSHADKDTQREREGAAAPSLACLFFLRRWSQGGTAAPPRQVSSESSGGGLDTDRDTAMTSFLCQKICTYYEPDGDLARRLTLLLGLVGGMGVGHSGKALLEQFQQRHSKGG